MREPPAARDPRLCSHVAMASKYGAAMVSDTHRHSGVYGSLMDAHVAPRNGTVGGTTFD